jgi:hypothetical protein
MMSYYFWLGRESVAIEAEHLYHLMDTAPISEALKRPRYGFRYAQEPPLRTGAEL